MLRSLTAPAILMGCLFVGLPVGGLRDPLLWTAVAGLVWLVAFASPPPSDPALKYWAGWLAWSLLSLSTCDQPLKGLYSFSRWATLVAYFHVAAEHWSGRDSRRWFIGLALCAPILGLGTLLVEGTVHPMTGLLRPYYNYTVFVEAAFFAAAIGALGRPDGPRGKARWALWGGMAFVLALIIKARSRSGLLAIAVAAVAWTLRRGKARWLAWGLLALIVAAVLAPRRLTDYLIKSDMSVWFTRPQIWTAALKVAADHPVLGEGPGNFEQGYLRHNFAKGWATNYGFMADHAHSELLEVVSTTGWVGLFLFLAALLRSWRPSEARAESPWGEAGFCAFAAMSAQCLIDNMLQMPALAMLFFTALICLRRPASPALGPREAVMGPKLWRGLCIIGFLLSSASFFPQWLVDRAWSSYRRDPDPGRRVEHIRAAVRIFPADHFLRETLARGWLELRPSRPDNALEELRHASRLDPTNAIHLWMQAELRLTQGRRSEALELLNRAIALEPNYLGARLSRAELWAQAGNNKASRRELDEISKRNSRLRQMERYSSYDEVITSFDERRFKAAAAPRPAP